MLRARLLAAAMVTMLAAPLALRASAPRAPRAHSTLIIRMILHAVGQEEYDIVSNADGTRTNGRSRSK